MSRVSEAPNETPSTPAPEPRQRRAGFQAALATEDKGGEKADWFFHSFWLLLPAAVLLLSLLLEVRDSRHVVVPVINRPLPELCTFRRLTGIDCAGCGLTRCFISISHGRLDAAWNYHPVGFVLYAMAAFQIPWRGLQLWRLSRGERELRLGTAANPVYYSLGVVLLSVWIARIWGQVFG